MDWKKTKIKDQQQPGASELEGLGKAIGATVAEGAKPIAEAVGRVGAALAMESARPSEGNQQNMILGEPEAGTVYDQRGVNEVRSELIARGEKNIVAINAHRDWRATPIQGWSGLDNPVK